MNIMSSRQIRTAMALLFLPVVATPPVGAQEDTFEWSRSMATGQFLEVKGISGQIRAEPASGDRARVLARKDGDHGDFREVAIEVEEVEGGVVICAVYGAWRHGEGHCLPDGHEKSRSRAHRNRSIDVHVDYVVRIPAGVEFRGTMVSGPIRARKIRSPVSVNTVSGDIEISTTETASANTVSGNLDVEMGSLEWDDMDFNTVSGDITLRLPADFSADIDFSSLSGDFDTDFDIEVRRQRGRWVGTDLEGTIGGGGRALSFHTVSGDVRLRRSRS